MSRLKLFLVVSAASLLLGGCGGQRAHHGRGWDYQQAWGAITNAVCVVRPTEGNRCFGVVRFTQTGRKVRVVADISGLSPNAQHAIHIHTYGDATSPDGKSAGGHYNPEEHAHGLPGQAARHAGDLGTLVANNNGTSHYEIVADNITIAGPHNPIIGRAIIVHAKRDTGVQPTGGAGARIACGVIGIAH